MILTLLDIVPNLSKKQKITFVNLFKPENIKCISPRPAVTSISGRKRDSDTRQLMLYCVTDLQQHSHGIGFTTV
jgi:hypothetical protein